MHGLIVLDNLIIYKLLIKQLKKLKLKVDLNLFMKVIKILIKIYKIINIRNNKKNNIKVEEYNKFQNRNNLQTNKKIKIN